MFGERRISRQCSSVCLPAAHVVTKAGSRGWLRSMGFAECKTREGNIQGEDTCRKGMKYWGQNPRENSGREARRWVFHTPLIRTLCALPPAAPAPPVEGVRAEVLGGQTCFSRGLVRVALWDKSAIPQPGVYCCFTFGRELKPV